MTEYYSDKSVHGSPVWELFRKGDTVRLYVRDDLTVEDAQYLHGALGEVIND